jgi:hypothetical protein
MRCSRTARAIGSSFHLIDEAAADCSGGEAPLQMRSARDQVRVRKTALDHLCDLSRWVLHFRLRSRSVHCRAAASDCPVDRPRHPPGNHVRPNRNRRRCAARFSCGWIANVGAAYLRTEIVHDTAQHSEALVADGPFRYTRNPLYLASLLMAAGIGVLASRSGFVFLGAGKLDFCLSGDSSRRRIPAENPKGIISRVLPSGAAFLARAKGAGSVRKSPTRLGVRPLRERALSGCSVLQSC